MFFFLLLVWKMQKKISISFPGICGGVVGELSCKGNNKTSALWGGVNLKVIVCTEVLNLRSRIVDLPR